MERLGTLIGRFYLFAFITSRRPWLGLTQANWLRLVAVLLTAVSWLLGWGLPFSLLLTAITVTLFLLYWRARRSGYITFYPLNAADAFEGDAARPLADNQKISLRATGTFSVLNRSRYVILLPATLWRVPLGDHVVMVEHSAGRFLYQFIVPADFHGARLGHLYLGPQPQNAIELTFDTDWPSEDKTLMYYVRGKEALPPKVRRIIYLTFVDTDDWQTVWASFARIPPQTP